MQTGEGYFPVYSSKISLNGKYFPKSGYILLNGLVERKSDQKLIQIIKSVITE